MRLNFAFFDLFVLCSQHLFFLSSPLLLPLLMYIPIPMLSIWIFKGRRPQCSTYIHNFFKPCQVSKSTFYILTVWDFVWNSILVRWQNPKSLKYSYEMFMIELQLMYSICEAYLYYASELAPPNSIKIFNQFRNCTSKSETTSSLIWIAQNAIIWLKYTFSYIWSEHFMCLKVTRGFLTNLVWGISIPTEILCVWVYLRNLHYRHLDKSRWESCVLPYT